MSLLVKGVNSFLELQDTPASYGGEANKTVRVKSTEDCMEFYPFSKFTLSHVFDGGTATPSTHYFIPFTLIPYWAKAPVGEISGFGAVVVNNNIYVFGGRYGPGGSYFNECHKFNLTTQRWEKLANMPAPAYAINPRSGAASYNPNNGKIYWVCKDNAANEKLYEYDIAGDSWASYSLPSIGGGGVNSAMCCACSDYCYVHQNNYFGGQNNKMYAFDYMAHTFTAKTSPASTTNQVCQWGKIGDEIYATVSGSPYPTYKYDKALDSWINQGQPHPSLIGNNGGACFVEDENAMWAVQAGSTTFAVYRYTTTGGWVTLFTNTRSQREWDICLVPSGHTSDLAYMLWGIFGLSYGSMPFAGGTIAKYTGSAVWYLYGGSFSQGDLIIIHEWGGVPVNIERNGVLLAVCDGMNVYYVVEAGTYRFTLSKDYDFAGVDIYRSVWG
jgi:hypothetical protein